MSAQPIIPYLQSVNKIMSTEILRLLVCYLVIEADLVTVAWFVQHDAFVVTIMLRYFIPLNCTLAIYV